MERKKWIRLLHVPAQCEASDAPLWLARNSSLCQLAPLKWTEPSWWCLSTGVFDLVASHWSGRWWDFYLKGSSDRHSRSAAFFKRAKVIFKNFLHLLLLMRKWPFKETWVGEKKRSAGWREELGGWFRQNPYQRIPGLHQRTVLATGAGWGTHYSVILRVEQTARMERRGVGEKDAERVGRRKERGGERSEKERFFIFLSFLKRIKIPVTKRRSLGRAFNWEQSAGCRTRCIMKTR